MSKEQTHLQAALQDTPKDIQPKRDLWQGIELGIERQADVTQSRALTRVTKSGQYAIAASFSALAFVGWLAMQQLTPLTSEPDISALSLANSLSEQHQLNRQGLLVSLQDQPALTENWQEQLTELDAAAMAIKTALEHDPNNMALVKMLQSVYQQQLQLIERVHSPLWRQI